MKAKTSYEPFPYKTTCEFCPKGSKPSKRLFSFVDKKGRYRAACKKHLKKIS